MVGRRALTFIGLHLPITPDPELLEEELEYIEGVSIISQTWDMLGRLARWGAEMWVGGIILGLLSGLVSYFIMVRLIEGHRLIRAQRRAKRWQKTWGEKGREDSESNE